MRLPKIRFTIGQIMILVAAAGCILAVGNTTIRLWERWNSPAVTYLPSTRVIEWEETVVITTETYPLIAIDLNILCIIALTILGIGSLALWIWMSRRRRTRRNA
jgi:hypothetical protein